jgi:hypothetical protein
MATARVARRFLRATTNRRVSSAEGYYDSQSGTFISTTKTLRIFEHSASAHAGSGALVVVAPADRSSGRVARVVTVEDVDVARAAGAVGVRYDCAVDDRGAALDVAAAAAAAGLSCDVGFADAAADVDHVSAELVVGELCDAGARALLFPVGDDDLDDDDDLRELFSVLGGVDVVGAPVRQRLGFSATATDVAALVELAESLEVTQFDASATGAARPATAALLAALGAPHGVDVDALLRDKD